MIFTSGRGLRTQLTALALICCSAALWSQVQTDKKAVFTQADVFGLEWVTDPQISPDGKWIVYVRLAMDVHSDQVRRSLWLTTTDGALHRPLSNTANEGALPRWSPDGRRVAFIAKNGESGAQLFVHWLDSGTSGAITHLPEAPSSLAWSPNGNLLAFTMPVSASRKAFSVELPKPPEGVKWAEPPKVIDRMVYRADGAGYLADNFSQVFVVAASGGAARQLSSGDFEHSGPAVFTADSSSVLISANRRKDAELEPNDSEVYQIAVSGGEAKAVTDRRGPDFNPIVSGDGRFLAWLGYDDRYQGYQVTQLWLRDLHSGATRALTAQLDRDVESPQFAADSRSIYFQYDDHGQTRIARLGLDGKLQQLANDLGGTDVTRPYSGGSFSVARDGRFAYTRRSTTAPAELGVGTAANHIVQLTHLNANSLGTRDLGTLEQIEFVSKADGLPLQGWILKPPGFDPAKQYPMILEIHGGPAANYQGQFAAETHLYAAAGNVVLFMNPRGSTAYGEAFGQQIHHNYPSLDYDDLMTGVDEVLKRGYVDAKQLYVTGGSGGGVLTSWIVGHTDRFRAAVVVKPVINWTSFVLTADQTNYFYRYWFEAPPWEAQTSYWKRSPLAYVGNVKTPTMVISGELDFRTPISEAEQFYQALKLRQVDTVLVRVPGASHDISARPSLLNAKVAYVLGWFAAHRN
jgi:acylaminoacyl-peptidase